MVVVSVDSSREWWSRRSSWARLCSSTAVSTVDQLPSSCVGVGGGGYGDGVSGQQSRVVESAEQLCTAVLFDGSVDSGPAAVIVCGWWWLW